MTAAARARRLTALTGARAPIVLAPMAGSGGVDLAVAAIAGGALGSLPCALLDPATVADQVTAVRARVAGPIALNFFCHDPGGTPEESEWLATLAPFYAAEGVAPPQTPPPSRRPFDTAMCDVVERVRPEVVSFHFGLPDTGLLARVRATGARIFATATTVAEARILAENGCDAVVAQGFEAGGHAGYFLDGHRPVGLVALVPQIADAVDLPVIAAGGIADARGVAAAFALGASGVQIGTAYLACPESMASAPHRRRLGTPEAAQSVFTNLFSGGLARGMRNRLIDAIGPIHPAAPRFPHAGAALVPLRAAAETDGRDDYSPLWAGQSAPFARVESARLLTERLARAIEGVTL